MPVSNGTSVDNLYETERIRPIDISSRSYLLSDRETVSPDHENIREWFCERCGSSYTAFEENAFCVSSISERYFLCPECKENAPTCSTPECNNIIHINENYLSIGNMSFCSACFKVCSCCNKKRRNQFFLNWGGLEICMSCVKENKLFYCEKCKQVSIEQPSTLPHRTIDGKELCTECTQQIKPFCNRCGSDRQIIFNQYGLAYCEACIKHDIYVLKNYSYKPIPDFYSSKEDTKPLYMGIEIELTEKERIDASLTLSSLLIQKHPKLKDWLYLKEDGSITHGFEIVSHPSTLEVYQEKIKLLSNILTGTNLIENGSTGIHVHIDKKYLTTNDIVKITMFVHMQKDLIKKIARRSDTRFSTYKTLFIKSLLEGTPEEKKEAENYTIKNKTNGRYEAVNFENNNTIELRMFHSSTEYYKIMSIIEFTYSLVHFVKKHRTPSFAKDDIQTKYIKYINNNKKQYPNLLKLIGEL